MALEGTLKDFSLADIFQLIGLQRKTGVLTLKGKEDVVTISFLEGKVVSADSLQKRLENRLGNVLIKQARLTDEQLSQALEIQNQTLQRLGFILLNNGFISEDELKDALQLQILQIIFRLFRWHDGEYHFSQETTIEYDRDFVTPITAESLLMEGARMMDEWPIIEKKIPNYGIVFRKVESKQRIEVGEEEEDSDDLDFGFGDSPAPAKAKAVPVASDVIKLSRLDGMVYNLVDGVSSVGEIVERSRLNEFETVKRLYELGNRNLIAPAKRERTAPEIAEAEAEAEAAELAEEAERRPYLFAAIAIAWLLGSLATMHRNPLNMLTIPPQTAPAVHDYERAVSFLRVERLGNAVDVHRLALGSYPRMIAELASAGIVGENAMEDPWGRPYKYVLNPPRFYLYGSDAQGKTDQDLLLVETMKPVSGAAASTSGSPDKTGSESSGGIKILD